MKPEILSVGLHTRYLGFVCLRADMNHHDRDVLRAGAAVPAMSDVFDPCWNSPWSYPIAVLAPEVAGGSAAAMQLVTVRPGCTGTRAPGTKGQYTGWAVDSSVIASRDYGDTSPSMCGAAFKVALVDDDESVRRALGRLLRMAGMQVDLYASGREFLAAIPDDRPDCVVLDMHMPEMTGMEVQVVLASRRPDLPIVFITAHDNPVVVRAVLAAGAETVLRKPFSEQELTLAILAAVGE